MSGLIIYNEPSDDEKFVEILNRCEENMISPFSNTCTNARNTSHIISFYNDNMRYGKGIPSVHEILNNVYDHNRELVWEIAAAEFHLQKDDQVHYDEDSEYEEITMLVEGHEQYYCDHLYSGIQNYIEDALEELALSYTYDMDSGEYCSEDSEKTKGVTIVLNDCQNVLFPQFMHETDMDFCQDCTNRPLFVVSK